jgi:hypothetical protein
LIVVRDHRRLRHSEEALRLLLLEKELRGPQRSATLEFIREQHQEQKPPP